MQQAASMAGVGLVHTPGNVAVGTLLQLTALYRERH